ncbi:MAG: HD domain-containing phosphohydrolase [Nitrospirota bacterium]
MRPKILVIDDELIIRDICSGVLNNMGFDVYTTGDALYALNYSLSENFDLIITDVRMPRMNGIELMKNVRKAKPFMPFIVITGYGTYDMAVEALREGAYDFINKPFRIEELKISVKNTLEKMEMSRELNRLKVFSHISMVSELIVLSRDKIQASGIILESILRETGAAEGAVLIENTSTGELVKLLSVPENIDIDNEILLENYAENTVRFISDFLYIPLRASNKKIGMIVITGKEGAFSQADMETAVLLANHLGISLENISLFENLSEKINQIEDLFFNTVKAMSMAIDAKSPWTKGHSERVAKYSMMIARELKFDEESLKLTELSSILHDIGKIGTYDYLLEKPGRFLPEEYEMVKKHPEKGVSILSPIKEMSNIVNIVRHHHERYDGKGYPHGISGDNIPLISRIISVADSYDSMTSDRPYRKTPGREKAVDELLRCSNSQFDGNIVRTFIKALAADS